jgi:hypothetical protein
MLAAVVEASVDLVVQGQAASVVEVPVEDLVEQEVLEFLQLEVVVDHHFLILMPVMVVPEL